MCSLSAIGEYSKGFDLGRVYRLYYYIQAEFI